MTLLVTDIKSSSHHQCCHDGAMDDVQQVGLHTQPAAARREGAEHISANASYLQMLTKNMHSAYLSLKYRVLVTAWIIVGTMGNPKNVKRHQLHLASSS